MSCFMCSPLQIAVAAVATADHMRKTRRIYRDEAALCDTYFAMNVHAVRARYGDCGAVRPDSWIPSLAAAEAWIKGARPIDVRKALECFEYQCDESNALEIFPGVDELQETIRALTKATPGHMSAVWRI